MRGAEVGRPQKIRLVTNLEDLGTDYARQYHRGASRQKNVRGILCDSRDKHTKEKERIPPLILEKDQ